jgi:hypothetical protein
VKNNISAQHFCGGEMRERILHFKLLQSKRGYLHRAIPQEGGQAMILIDSRQNRHGNTNSYMTQA